MSSHRLTPFDVVEKLIGPPEVVGPIVSIDPKSSYGWRQASAARDAGDIPSARTMRKLLAHAAGNHIPLTATHLLYGASVAEVEQLLDAMRAPEFQGAAE